MWRMVWQVNGKRGGGMPGRLNGRRGDKDWVRWRLKGEVSVAATSHISADLWFNPGECNHSYALTSSGCFTPES